MKETTFEQQFYYAQYIKKNKLNKWLNTSKEFIPEYDAELLFHQRVSHVVDMLKIDSNLGFVYDPKTLEEGIDILMRILVSKSNAPQKRLEIWYESFENAQIRFAYFRRIIRTLGLEPVLARSLLKDLQEIAPTLTDPEEIEINQNLTRQISVLANEINNREEQEQEEQQRNSLIF